MQIVFGFVAITCASTSLVFAPFGTTIDAHIVNHAIATPMRGPMVQGGPVPGQVLYRTQLRPVTAYRPVTPIKTVPPYAYSRVNSRPYKRVVPYVGVRYTAAYKKAYVW